jgi:hypothetical protein
MPVIETVLIYGVIPAAVFLLLAVVTLLPGRGAGRTKYRPGQSWTAEPAWYEPHPGADAHADGHSVPGPGATAALAIGGHPHEAPGSDAHRRTAAGGARGTW